MITVKGYSDDGPLIGDDLVAQFDGLASWPRENEPGSPAYLAFSDGTLISYSYGLAGWCFDIARKGSAEVRVVKSDPGGDYSWDVRTDRVEIDGGITWVLHGSEVAK